MRSHIAQFYFIHINCFWIREQLGYALWLKVLCKKDKDCLIALIAAGEVAVKEPTCSWQRCNRSGAPLLFLTMIQLWREPGTHSLLGEQREFLKNPAHKLCFAPVTFSISDEHSNHSATVPLLMEVSGSNTQLANTHQPAARHVSPRYSLPLCDQRYLPDPTASVERCFVWFYPHHAPEEFVNSSATDGR